MSNQFRSQGGARRPLRLSAELERLMPDLIRDLMSFPSSVLVTVTGVDVSEDLSLAQVYVSAFGENANSERIVSELNASRGKFRTEVAKRFVMRQHPEIKFRYDDTPARAARIEELLKKASGTGSQ
ncbi:MAG: 30S ribosome-binding factor RbfA [Calditrichaeota bacterium]|nr:30S ribosome-binding factor RbfA [Calditrichota bacterium]MCB9366526.1 30S ribosome-binding factor RbfA [Calditrichota bacterium]MCB9391216.1 30S ribosome-binding factor RbfA [Calditrichota bacterium]